MANRVRKTDKGKRQRGEASGSQNVESANFRDRFPNDTTHKKYMLFMVNKAVIFERGLDLTACPDAIRQEVEASNWNNVVRHPDGAANISLTREFFAALAAKPNIPVSTEVTVRGVKVHFNVTRILEVFGFEYTARTNYIERQETWVQTHPGMDINVAAREAVCPELQWSETKSGVRNGVMARGAQFNEISKLWFLFVSASLIPSSHLTVMYLPVLRLLWAIREHTYVSVGEVIIESLWAWKRNPRKALPFPHLVTQLCRKWEVPVYESDIEDFGPPILNSLSSLGSNQGQKKKKEKEVVEASGQHQRMGIDYMYHGFQAIAANQECIRQDQTSIVHRLDAMMLHHGMNAAAFAPIRTTPYGLPPSLDPATFYATYRAAAEEGNDDGEEEELDGFDEDE